MELGDALFWKCRLTELKKRRELLKEKYSEDKDGEMGTKDIS